MEMEINTSCRLTEGCRGTVSVSVELAAHDDSLLDVVVSCDGCARRLNSFLAFDDMEEL